MKFALRIPAITTALFLIETLAASAQYVPPPAGVFTYSGSSWAAAASASTSDPLTYTPPAVAAYCYNSTTKQWVPADSSCFGGGSSAWSALTAPTANLSLIMASYNTIFANTNPFTAQASFYSPWQFAGSGLDFGAEWNALYAAYMPNAYPSDEFDVGITVPNTSLAFQSNAIGAFADCAQPTGLHYCLALYGQAQASHAGSQTYGVNTNVFDGNSTTNFAAALYAAEFNSQVFNASTIGDTLRISANIAHAGTVYHGIHVALNSGKYTNDILLDNDTGTVALNVGYDTATGSGMPLIFNNASGNSSQTYDSSNRMVFSASEVMAPAFGTSSNCVSNASPAVCGTATAGIVAVPAGGTTLVVNTSKINTGSEVLLTFDSSLGSSLSVTCNTSVNQPTVSARTASTSFTITMGSSVTTNPACISFAIINSLATASITQMTDTFVGTNGTALASHTADTGQTWTQTFTGVWNGSLALNGSNSLVPTSISLYYASLTPATADYTVTIGCTLPASGSLWCQPLARLNTMNSGAFNGYGCLFQQSIGLKLLIWTGAGTNTQIGTTDVTATGGTHTIGIKTAGTTITCLLDGSPSVSATGTDGTYTAAGSVGLALNGLGTAGYLINSPFTVK